MIWRMVIHPPRHVITPGARWSVTVLFIVTIALAAGNLLWTAHEVGILARADATSCNFYADIAGAPVAPLQSTHKATLFAVSVIAHSRTAWRGRHCPGHLPPPAPSFTHWARYYHLSAR